jgi:plasmid stabilization system protein ParE
MSLELSFHPAAEREVLAAAAWYTERSAVAAQAFLHELDVVVARMLEAPERWPKSLHGARRIVFPRFPFNLVYRVLPGVAEVVAVAHQSRRPGYWKSR